MSDRRPGTDLPAPLLRARRHRTIRTGILALAGLALVAGAFTTILLSQQLGIRAWQEGDPTAAGRHFTLNQQLNLVERWLAPFNQGVTRHGRGEWLEAAALYEEASATAPESARCRVLLNWSWALESAGDQADRAGQPEAAHRNWATAKEVLSRADGCDDGSSGLEPEDADRPSTSPTPTQAPPPSATPSSQPTDPGDDPAHDPDQPQPGSEQDQVNQTRQRIEQKVGVPGDTDSDQPDDPEPDQSQRLDERNQQAADQRQRKQDEQRPTDDDPPVRSW